MTIVFAIVCEDFGLSTTWLFAVLLPFNKYRCLWCISVPCRWTEHIAHISLTGKGKVTEVHLHHTCSAVIGAKRENWRYLGRVVKVIKDVTVVALCYTWSFLGHFGSRGELWTQHNRIMLGLLANCCLPVFKHSGYTGQHYLESCFCVATWQM